MSKVRKLSVKKNRENKSSLYLPAHNLGQTQSLVTLQDNLEAPGENFTKRKIVKIRSTSTIKDRSAIGRSSIGTTPLKSKPSESIAAVFNLNPSNIKKIAWSKSSIKRPKISFDLDLQEIEKKLEEISIKHKENGIDSEIFEKYEECFLEVISKVPNISSILAKLKFGYEDWINSKISTSKEVKKLKTEIFEFSKKLTEEIDENKLLHKKVQKFSRENVELGRALDEKEGNFKTLQDYLLKISSLNIDEVPQDIESWKVLISENKNYSELCSKLKNKIKSMKLKENKLMNLFWKMKQKGYPVEKMYDKLEEQGKGSDFQDKGNFSIDQAEKHTRRSSKKVTTGDSQKNSDISI